MLRLRGDYLAIVTLGFGESFAYCQQSARFHRGAAGVLRFAPVQRGFPAGNVSSLLYLVFGAALIALLSALKRPHGRAWSAMKSDEKIGSHGVNLIQSKLTALRLARRSRASWRAICCPPAGTFPCDFRLDVSNEVLSWYHRGMGSIPGRVMGGSC